MTSHMTEIAKEYLYTVPKRPINLYF